MNPRRGVSVKPFQATARRCAAVCGVVGVRVGLPRHDREVEGVVVNMKSSHKLYFIGP